jgi:hypothetical protein
MWNEDYKDMLSALLDESADFILVGAYALAAHGFPRATLDMDLWVRPSPDNAQKVCNALALHFMYYNFCRIHRSLRVTPAMEAAVADHVWII